MMFAMLHCFSQDSFVPDIFDSLADVPDNMANISIKNEIVYRYKLKHHQIADSSVFENKYYDDNGNVTEIDEFNEDGKTAKSITQMVYGGHRLYKLRIIRETYTDGINFSYKENGSVDDSYSYRVMTKKPTDTVYITYKQYVYDSVARTVKIYLQTSKQPLHLWQQWHYEKNKKTMEPIYENPDRTEYLYEYDSLINKWTCYLKKENEDKKIINEKFFDDNKKCIKEIWYVKVASTVFYDKVEIAKKYNPDGTLFEEQYKYENFSMGVYRHYYFLK